MQAQKGTSIILAGVFLALLVLLPTQASATKIISVLDLNNRALLSEAETSYLTDLARDALARNLPLQEFTIMTRESILELLPEGTRLSDCLDASCEVEIGRTLGADYVVSGEVLAFGKEIRLLLKVHHCQSAAFIGSESGAGVALKEVEASVPLASGNLADLILRHSGGLGRISPSPIKQNPVTSLDDWILKPETQFGVKANHLGLAIGMVRISAGEFLMGSPRYEKDRDRDEDRHQVTLSRGFLLSSTEITQDQWFGVMGTFPSRFEGGSRPVENITFAECIEFCNQLSQQENLTPVYGQRGGEIFWNREASGYRLPTEAEWEYACRAGSQKRYTNGDLSDDLIRVAWCRYNSTGQTQDVGQRLPNSWGLYDMHGNVWEWCWNWSEKYPTRFAVDPEGPDSGVGRVIRGGSWDNSLEACRSANHNSAKPGFHGGVLGFRVARTVFE